MYINVKRTNKKIISLSVDSDTICVVAHYKATLNDIKKAIADNYSNLVAMLNNNKTAFNVATTALSDANKYVTDGLKAELYSGKMLYLCGRAYQVLPTTDKKTHLDGDNVFIHECYMQNRVEKMTVLKKYVRKYATDFLCKEISDYGAKLSLCPAKIELKDIKGDTWIQCSNSTDRKITMDYRAVQLPDFCRKYLIIHCFMHFKDSAHSDMFWDNVKQFVGNYPDVIGILNSYLFLKDL